MKTENPPTASWVVTWRPIEDCGVYHGLVIGYAPPDDATKSAGCWSLMIRYSGGILAPTEDWLDDKGDPLWFTPTHWAELPPAPWVCEFEANRKPIKTIEHEE